MRKILLVVDDEEIIRRSIRRILSESFHIVEAANGEEAIGKVKSVFPDIVLLDQRLPLKQGIDVLREIKEFDPGISVVMMTAYGEVRLAVEAMRIGASYFIEKPFDNDEIQLILQHAVQEQDLTEEVRIRRNRDQHDTTKVLLGESEAMRKLRHFISKVSQSDASPVLILGESGVGKELVASSIHFEGQRRDNPFMVINCSAIPAQLMESELFGYEKGAFTDARQRKRGLIEVTNNGSLFLDEIGDLDISLQAKLLRFLEEKKFRRVGGMQELGVDINITAATNIDLEAAIAERKFRQDLFFRLNLMTIIVPPLRTRGRDIIVLAEHFLEEFNRKYRKSFSGISLSAEEILLHYSWPGNVRELKNLIERTVIIETGDSIEATHVSFLAGAAEQEAVNVLRPLFDGDDFQPLNVVEMAYIQRVMEHCGNNKTRAAKILGFSREGLSKKLQRMKNDSAKGASE